MNKTVAVLCSLLVTGCAGLSVADCGPDWHAIGVRDGRMGAVSQAANYAARCAVPVDAERYAEGWREGNAMRRPVASM